VLWPAIPCPFVIAPQISGADSMPGTFAWLSENANPVWVLALVGFTPL